MHHYLKQYSQHCVTRFFEKCCLVQSSSCCKATSACRGRCSSPFSSNNCYRITVAGMSLLDIPDAAVKILGQRAGAQLSSRCIYSTARVVGESDSSVYIYNKHGEDVFVLKEQVIEDRGPQIGSEMKAGLILSGACPGLVTPAATFHDGTTATFIYRPAGVSLSELKHKFTHAQRAKVAPWIIGSVAAVLDYMHDRDMLHRDVKPCNVVINRATKTVSLIDLGCAAPFYTRVFAGTPGHVPPNVYDWVIQDKGVVAIKDQRGGKALGKLHTSKFDAWCLGMLAVSWLEEGVPEGLCDPSDEDAMRDFDKDDVETFLEDTGILTGDELLADFLRQSLDPDTATRWTIKQLMDHPYLRDLVPKVQEHYEAIRSDVAAADATAAAYGRQVHALRQLGVQLPYKDCRFYTHEPDSTHNSSGSASSAAYSAGGSSAADVEPAMPDVPGAVEVSMPADGDSDSIDADSEGGSGSSGFDNGSGFDGSGFENGVSEAEDDGADSDSGSDIDASRDSGSDSNAGSGEVEPDSSGSRFGPGDSKAGDYGAGSDSGSDAGSDGDCEGSNSGLDVDGDGAGSSSDINAGSDGDSDMQGCVGSSLQLDRSPADVTTSVSVQADTGDLTAAALNYLQQQWLAAVNCSSSSSSEEQQQWLVLLGFIPTAAGAAEQRQQQQQQQQWLAAAGPVQQSDTLSLPPPPPRVRTHWHQAHALTSTSPKGPDTPPVQCSDLAYSSSQHNDQQQQQNRQLSDTSSTAGAAAGPHTTSTQQGHSRQGDQQPHSAASSKGVTGQVVVDLIKAAASAVPLRRLAVLGCVLGLRAAAAAAAGFGRGQPGRGKGSRACCVAVADGDSEHLATASGSTAAVAC